jgi:hypothetical protein
VRDSNNLVRRRTEFVEESFTGIYNLFQLFLARNMAENCQPLLLMPKNETVSFLFVCLLIAQTLLSNTSVMFLYISKAVSLVLRLLCSQYLFAGTFFHADGTLQVSFVLALNDVLIHTACR